MTAYDTIVIGAGHNGLVCAGYLAQAGQRVLVVEADDFSGGLASTREFHAGFRVPIAHTVSHFSDKVAKDLGISNNVLNGAARSLPLTGMAEGVQPVMLDGESTSGVDSAAVDAYQRYIAMLSRFASVLNPFWERTMPRIGASGAGEIATFARLGFGLRRLGKQDMGEFLRVAALPMRDLLDEFFDDDLLKATLCWDGLVGSKMAPRSPNSAVLALLYRLSAHKKGRHRSSVGLIDSIQNAVESAGAEIRFAAEVEQILVDSSRPGLAVEGVRLANGERIPCRRVVSSADPQQTFIRLLGVEFLDIGFTNRIRRLRCGGLVGKLHLALAGLPEFQGLDRPDGRIVIAPTMDAIEFAFDDAKYGDLPANPVVELVIPSIDDATLAPDGHHVLSAQVMYVPGNLKGGWTDIARTDVSERVINVIASVCPDIREQIVANEFLTPADIEREFRVTGGHWHHTDFAMDQLLMMRPTYDAAQYATPIPGLYLCGAGCHPGGDLTGLPGHNAAQEILR